MNGRHRRPALRPEPTARVMLRATRELLIVAVLALALSLVVKTWFVQAFYIPSGSMQDTLLVGDRVLVNKLVPGVVDVRRGDVVVFTDPGDWLPPAHAVDRGPLLNGIQRGLEFVGLLPASGEDHLIKRVIGLPGDHVACCDAEGHLTVNGVAVVEPYVRSGDVASTREFDITVPAGRVWVMGDHRSNSEDSRFHDPTGDGSEGSVPIERVTGRAVVTVWPVTRLGGLDRFASVFADVPAPRAGPS